VSVLTDLQNTFPLSRRRSTPPGAPGGDVVLTNTTGGRVRRWWDMHHLDPLTRHYLADHARRHQDDQRFTLTARYWSLH
jgi:hypothetical protein